MDLNKLSQGELKHQQLVKEELEAMEERIGKIQEEKALFHKVLNPQQPSEEDYLFHDNRELSYENENLKMELHRSIEEFNQLQKEHHQLLQQLDSVQHKYDALTNFVKEIL